MKQLYMQTETPKNILERNQANHLAIFCRKTNCNMNLITPISVGHWRGPTITENLCKGPPGRPRSPGMFRGHPPDGSSPPDSGADRAASPLSSGREGQGVSPQKSQILNTEFQFLNHTNTKFYSQLNFTIMKKLFFILILAVFASMTVSYGQTYVTVPSGAPTCITPTALSSCSTTNPLNPSPGQNYTYTVNTSAATNDIRWFVINNEDLKNATPVVNIIDPTSGVLASTSTYIDKSDGTGKYILALGTNNAYNLNGTSGDATSQGGTSIDISWKNFDGNQPHEILLVAYVTDNAGCTDNIVVWRIVPKNTFTLDIASLKQDGTKLGDAGSTTVGPCVSEIEKATYASVDNTSGTGNLTVDYGENWVFFIVNANNFVDSWMPTFQITYTGQAAAVNSASWTYLQAATNSAATWNAIDVSTGVSAQPVIAGGSAADGTPINTAGSKKVSGTGGECIVVRVRLDYGTTAENAVDRNLTLAVDGVMYDNDNATGTFYDNSTLFGDLHHATCLTDGFTNDVVTTTITGRPEITAVAPATPVETKSGDGQ